jgi:hypothetical protein
LNTLSSRVAAEVEVHTQAVVVQVVSARGLVFQ